jgi:hypothetical protein
VLDSYVLHRKKERKAMKVDEKASNAARKKHAHAHRLIPHGLYGEQDARVNGEQGE